ncbi:helix-turn-helix domain-containing protein [Sphingomicrobium sp. XHP0235]|uniref:Crp/Fnr family transcriptional regulator n=1 Tax=Sphingomicrobium aquimarinum TaxID=3133971 RepID=UPI0031FE908A
MLQSDPFAHFANEILPTDLSVSSLTRMQTLARIHCVKKGELVELNGQSERWVVFLSSGAAKLVAHVGTDRDQIICFAFGGELLALSGSSQSQYSLHAMTACHLVAFPADELTQTATENSDAARIILESSFAALDRAREKSVLLGRKTASERMASFLLSMADRIGKSCGKTISLHLPMTRREIAESLGLTIETVSRQLTVLRSHSIIRTQGRSEICILDTAQLGQRAALLDCLG